MPSATSTPRSFDQPSYTQEEDDFIINLKENFSPELSWQEIAQRYSAQYPQYQPPRSKGALQVRYSRTLQPSKRNKKRPTYADTPPTSQSDMSDASDSETSTHSQPNDAPLSNTGRPQRAAAKGKTYNLFDLSRNSESATLSGSAPEVDATPKERNPKQLKLTLRPSAKASATTTGGISPGDTSAQKVGRAVTSYTASSVPTANGPDTSTLLAYQASLTGSYPATPVSAMRSTANMTTPPLSTQRRGIPTSRDRHSSGFTPINAGINTTPVRPRGVPLEQLTPSQRPGSLLNPEKDADEGWVPALPEQLLTAPRMFRNPTSGYWVGWSARSGSFGLRRHKDMAMEDAEMEDAE